MSRRIDIELTSARDDRTFTWRAAGARQPKGVVEAATLPAGSTVGDVLKVEIETGLDGSEITQVIPGRTTRHEPERLELVARPPADDALVTSHLAPKGRGGSGNRRDRGDRPERRDGPGGPGGRGGRGDGRPKGRRPEGGPGDGRPGRDGREGREGRPTRERRPRTGSETPSEPPRPKAPRLRAGRAHRRAILDTLPIEQRPVAEQVLRGGMAGVRQAIDRDNEQRRTQGQPEVPADGLVALAESLLPRLRDAEWHDRADAALAQIDDLDLRDLRSVVVAADDHAKDETTRALAAELRTKLTERVDRAQSEWLDDLGRALDEKRVVRAIKLSSRPPKAGSPLPAPLADRIVEATNATLTPDAGSGRWIAVVDALAFSPVRSRVNPPDLPSEPSAELIELLTRSAARLPELAARFGIDPTTAPSAPPRTNEKRRRRGGKGTPAGTGTKGPKGAAPAKDVAPAEAVPEKSEPTAQATAPEPEMPSPATESATTEAAAATETPVTPSAAGGDVAEVPTDRSESTAEPSAVPTTDAVAGHPPAPHEDGTADDAQ